MCEKMGVSLTLAGAVWRGRLAAFDWGCPHFLSAAPAAKRYRCSPASCRHTRVLVQASSYASPYNNVECDVPVCALGRPRLLHALISRSVHLSVCVCVYRVVFSVCGSSVVRFPVLPPPPPPPSSLFPRSDLREEKKRVIY